MKEALIQVQNLCKSFKKLQAVKNLSLEINTGEVFGLLGPNGAGKTTTLEIMEGLQTADSGNVFIKGLTHQKHGREIRRITGIQLQSTALYEKIRVEEAINLFRSYYPNPKDTEYLLELVSLVEKRKSFVKNLSGGQKQRLALALALVHDPEVLFLDEPTTGLDPQARRNIWEVILNLKQKGKTIIMTTHYMDEAEQICDRLAIMDSGEIKRIGTPSELIRTLPTEAFIRLKLTGILPVLPDFAGVIHAHSENGYLLLESSNLTDTLRDIMRAEQMADDFKMNLQEMNIRKATLEDLFISMTGKSLRE